MSGKSTALSFDTMGTAAADKDEEAEEARSVEESVARPSRGSSKSSTAGIAVEDDDNEGENEVGSLESVSALVPAAAAAAAGLVGASSGVAETGFSYWIGVKNALWVCARCFSLDASSDGESIVDACRGETCAGVAVRSSAGAGAGAGAGVGAVSPMTANDVTAAEVSACAEDMPSASLAAPRLR